MQSLFRLIQLQLYFLSVAFEQNNLQQQTQQAAILQRQMAHHYQQQASQQFGMPHNGFQDPFIGTPDN